MTLIAPFGRAEIESIIPHRDPFLLIDEVVELVPGVRVAARKHLTGDEWWWPGHFPEKPVMPGVLTVEAIAQCGAVAVLAEPENQGKLAFFAGIDDVKFKRIVEPGDTIDLVCEIVQRRGPIGKGKGTAHVGGELACSGMLTFFVGDAP